jgi:hypothetical protein
MSAAILVTAVRSREVVTRYIFGKVNPDGTRSFSELNVVLVRGNYPWPAITAEQLQEGKPIIISAHGIKKTVEPFPVTSIEQL